MKYSSLASLLLIFALSACSDWLGNEEETPLPGKRISLRSQKTELVADSGRHEKMLLPAMPVNAAWPQAQGNATGVSGNLALAKTPVLRESVTIGDGAAFSSPLIPPPTVADGMVFAMDGKGSVSAHHAVEIEKRYWESDLLRHHEDDDSPLLGGGLAWAGNTLFAANDEGKVVAFNATDGSKRWVKELKLPLRSPPRVAGKLLLVLTADNQLLALMQSNGELSWSHRGISEVAGKLHASPPAIRDNTVLAAYSSGEITAIDLPTGSPLWSDNLAGAGPESPDPATFSTTAPIMATGLSFVGSSSLLAAFETDTGRRLWERKVPTQRAPWLAGNYLFLLTPDNHVAAIRGLDGFVAWIHQLPQEEDGDTILWNGPIVAGGRIWVVGDNGVLIALSPQQGKELHRTELSQGIRTALIVSGKAMYLLDEDAKLYRLQ